MAWMEITSAEYLSLAKGAKLGETLSDPDGRFGTPHMLTTWETPDGERLVRHQCWPIGHQPGHFARPCLYEQWQPVGSDKEGQA